jgi:hypothetical protein
MGETVWKGSDGETIRVMIEGMCKLCLETKPLRESHFIPAALYPRARKPSFASRNRRLVALDSQDKHIKDYVLCFDCEQRFDRNGESEVLYWVSPKSKTFRLGERLKVALPRDYDPSDPDQSINRYSGTDIGVDTDKFAYFAISVVWRGAAHDWVLPDGGVRPHDALGGFVEPMRLYLLGQAPFPPDTSVIVIVGSDDESRKVWTVPGVHVEANCLNFRFHTFGILFRVLMGYRQWDYFRDRSCTSPRKCIFYGSMKHRMPEIMQIFEDAVSKPKQPD